MSYPVPTNEAERVAAVRDLHILDTPPEERFDRITRLACRIFATPMAMVTLVSSDRVWIKAACGLPPIEGTLRHPVFCSHAIMRNEVFIVADATTDPRFTHSPLVTGGPSIRFYAGTPLRIVSGVNVGVLCIADTQARILTSWEQAVLEELGRAVVTEFENRLLECKAQSASRAKELFLANMSHELRTPLTAILGFGDLLADDLITNDERMEAASAMRRNGEALLSIINNLISCSELSSADQVICEQPVLPAEIIAGAAESFAERAKEAGLEFSVQWRGENPEVLADAGRVYEIVRHLVSNAVKFTPRGAVWVGGELELDDGQGGDQQRGMLAISVADTGIGMDPSEIREIFEPFRQADGSYTRRIGGAGLGLAIAERTVRLLGGEIHVESQSGRGSTFTVRIPVVRQKASCEPCDPPECGSRQAA
ncbi:MAG: GAF domain-containing sensor histidine kinase [Phycisphaerales bacterium]|nr:GAF domain-containing sensor histidine kinase [Phycisphaerales bacterium]